MRSFQSRTHILHDPPVAAGPSTQGLEVAVPIVDEAEPFEGDEYELVSCAQVVDPDGVVRGLVCVMRATRAYDDGDVKTASYTYKCKGPFAKGFDARDQSVMGAKDQNVKRKLAYLLDQQELAPTIEAVEIVDKAVEPTEI